MRTGQSAAMELPVKDAKIICGSIDEVSWTILAQVNMRLQDVEPPTMAFDD